MELNADFRVRVAVHAASQPWVPSPVPGVARRMLDRIGGEAARATSIVQYAPGSRFESHMHPAGEEFLVLDGVFSDEHGDYPAGWYVRNPPGSAHTPGSDGGCTIFVKLRQFAAADRAAVRMDARAPTVLYLGFGEEVRVEAWTPGARVERAVPAGIELLVIAGGFEEGGETFVAQSWLRLPAGSALRARAGSAGARVWVKQGSGDGALGCLHGQGGLGIGGARADPG